MLDNADTQQRDDLPKYVLVSVVYNEEARIGPIVNTIAKQTYKPIRWVIVSDGSTDRTDAMIQEFATQYEFIHYARQEKRSEDRARLEKVTIAQSRAMRLARGLCKDIPYAYMGNLDVDVILPECYYEKVIGRMEQEPNIGIGGGAAVNVGMDGKRLPGGFVKSYYVGGPIQLFRRACLEAIDGYSPFGHSDAVACAKASMNGWMVRCFTDIEVQHLEQPGNSVREKIPICFRMGQFDYLMGGHLVFQLVRCAVRIMRKPYVLAGSAMMAGYLWAWIKRQPVIPDAELRRFMQAEQWRKLRRLIGFGKRKA